jgi:hypothetical protein
MMVLNVSHCRPSDPGLPLPNVPINDFNIFLVYDFPFLWFYLSFCYIHCRAISTMAPEIWNPDKTLNINARDNDDMFCVGVAVSRGNARCRWRITGDKHSEVCSILDEMGTMPPTEISGSKLLSKLAKLSLCEEKHRHQKRDILERWDDVIEDVAKQYEEMEKLKRRNHKLKTELVKEREEREQLQKLLAKESADREMKKLSAQLGELNSQFASGGAASAIVASAQNENESETRESDLLLQVKELEHSLAQSRGQAERLAVQEAESSRQLTAEQLDSEKYRMNAWAEQGIQSKNLDDLKAELVEERRISAQRQKDHEVTAQQVDELQSQLSAQRQLSEQLRRNLEKATTDRKGLLAQTESLRAQSATESQSLNQLKRNLDKAEITQAALLKEKETSQSLLAAECQTSGQLEKKLESLKAELTSVQGTLERTQLDLTQSRKVHAEQTAADAASRAATTAETTRLLERIRQLEEQSRISFLSIFIGRIKGLAEHIALRATGGRWPRRGNRTDVDMV